MKKVFIDGEAGTTGLLIRERLKNVADVAVLSIDPQRRKDAQAKLELMGQADLVVLCLHDSDAMESVAMIDGLNRAAGPNAKVIKIIDASSAHRVKPGWVYGFAELASGQREAIVRAERVTNPGCYATGAIALLRPLVDAGILPADHPVCLPSVSGYSGGGRSLIQAHEAGNAAPFELYALGLQHKHVPEIMRYSGLTRRPLFVPSVGNFAQGMLVQLPLHLDSLPGKPTAQELSNALRLHYAGSSWVTVAEPTPDLKLDAIGLAGKDTMEMRVFANDEARHALLVARLDNLGKGASGAAVQNLRLMLGL